MNLSDQLDKILKQYFDHDVVYVSHERRLEAKQAILSLMVKMVPPHNRPHTMASENTDYYLMYADGFNACRSEILRRLGAV